MRSHKTSVRLSGREYASIVITAYISGLVTMHIFYTILGKSRGWF